jgi:hypothetical protein
VAGAFDDLQARGNRDQLDRFTYFFNRAEGIARPMHEKHRSPQ